MLPYLYYEMLPRAALKRTVPLGPFSHDVDDGIPLRKVRRCCIVVLQLPAAPCAVGGWERQRQLRASLLALSAAFPRRRLLALTAY